MNNNDNVLKNTLIYPSNVKVYNVSRIPNKPGFFIRLLERIIILLFLIGQKHRKVDFGMDKLGKKEQIYSLCNHQQFLDFIIAIKNTLPNSVHYPMSIEGFKVLPWKLIEKGGVIAKRKFNLDPSIVKLYINLAKMGRSVGSFPEARYSVTGELAYLPDSVGKLAKKLGLPVIVYVFHGHYLVNPVWGNGKKRKLPIMLERKYILTKEQLAALSTEEINEVIRKEMYYNEFEYQKQEGILIKEKYRAEGLHRILYKCPHCQKEFMMSSKDMFLKCDNCQKEYLYKETSELECVNGETIFDSVPKWLEWEREEVKKELLNKTYFYEEELQSYSLPHPVNVIDLQKVVIRHDENGFVVKGHYNDRDFVFEWTPLMNYSLQTEFSSPAFKKKDVFGLSTNNDTLFFIPKNNQVIQKLYFAVEELYRLNAH